MIQLQQATLQRGQRVLLDEAHLTIHAQQKMGIVGANGCGKSSLFLLLQGELALEHGELLLPKQLQIAHIQQQMPSGFQSALDYTLEGDTTYTELQKQLAVAEQHEDGMEIANIHHRLAEIDGYGIPSRAAKILTGLGFAQHELEQSIETFSGGWRMRLNLAQVLMTRADLLLLDEPTNHLDLEAILWLEDWLSQSSQTVLLISHDREFLDRVITHTVYFNDQQLQTYIGNYSAFEKQRAEQLALQQATYQKQEQKRLHLQKFVDRFRAKASKAKQAQSRIKMLEKIQWVASIYDSIPFQFEFKPTEKAGTPMLQVRHADIGYDDKLILNHINCSISDGDRIGLIGPNGAGKSTLIKLLAQKINLNSGELTAGNKIKIGYFAQHQLEQLDPTEGPLKHLTVLDNRISEGQARRYLGGFNFHNDDVFRNVGEFSGGEKARLVLALLIWQAPNLLLLDEPTNHLDLEMREALNLALQQYEGAMVIVSHDRYLLKCVTNELWLVANGQVQQFDGDMDDYRTWLSTHYQPLKKPKKAKQKNKQVLENKLAKLEQQLKRLQLKQEKLDQQLGDSELYMRNHASELQQLQTQRQNMLDKISNVEQQILGLMEELEGDGDS